MQIVHRTPIVIRPSLVNVVVLAFTYTFAITLEDGTAHTVTGHSKHSRNNAMVLALRRFGRMEEKGYQDGV